MKILKLKLEELVTKLKAQNNPAFEYFENLLLMIQEKPKEVKESILKSYAITQYANFDNNEELLLEEIWNLANEIKDY